MKYLSVLLCFFLCYELSTQEPRQPFYRRKRYLEVLDECQKLSGLSGEELKKFEHSGEAQDKLLSGDGDFKNLGCFLACVNQKFGVMTGNTFVRDEIPHDDTTMEEITSKEAERRMRLEETWNACMDTAEGAGGDECDVALAFHVCFEKSRRTLLPLE